MMKRISAVLIGLAILSLGAPPALAQQEDRRAQDAVDFFGGMCGRMIANWEPPVDHEQFRFAWLTQRQAASLGEELADLTVLSVAAAESDVLMIHYVTHRGLCGVEVEAAEPKAVDRAFEALINAAAKSLSLKPEIRSDETSEGNRTRIWRLGSPGDGYDIALSSSTDGDAAPQFIMTMMAVAPEDKNGP